MTRALPFLLALLTLAAALPARADFALSNLRFTLYHETAHAVIDQHDVALSGPEEIAADGFAVYLAHRLHDEGELRTMMADVTRQGRIDAARELFDPWAQYMVGPQRLAWAVCVWFGLAPEVRKPAAVALGMPPGNATRCEESGERVAALWEPLFVEMRALPPEPSFLPGRHGKSLRLLAPDLVSLNREVRLPRPVPVTVEECGEENAFYYHVDERIVLCADMLRGLRGIRDR